jgi:hypothetical protein
LWGHSASGKCCGAGTRLSAVACHDGAREAVRETWVPLTQPKTTSKWTAALTTVTALSASAAFSTQSAQALVSTAAVGSGDPGPLSADVTVGQEGTVGDSPAQEVLRSNVGTFIRDYSAKLISVSTSRAVVIGTTGMQGQLKGALDSLHTFAETQKTLDKRLEVLENVDNGKEDADVEEERDDWNGGLGRAPRAPSSVTGLTNVVAFRKRREEYKSSDDVGSALGARSDKEYYNNLVPHLERELGARSTWRTMSNVTLQEGHEKCLHSGDNVFLTVSVCASVRFTICSCAIVTLAMTLST